jgi:hypothetical protein
MLRYDKLEAEKEAGVASLLGGGGGGGERGRVVIGGGKKRKLCHCWEVATKEEEFTLEVEEDEGVV